MKISEKLKKYFILKKIVFFHFIIGSEKVKIWCLAEAKFYEPFFAFAEDQQSSRFEEWDCIAACNCTVKHVLLGLRGSEPGSLCPSRKTQTKANHIWDWWK